jgi:hypothetical protein
VRVRTSLIRASRSILGLPQIGLPEPQEQAEEAEEQHNADPGMDETVASDRLRKRAVRKKRLGSNSASPDRARRMSSPRDPVVDARACRITVDDDRIAGVNPISRSTS